MRLLFCAVLALAALPAFAQTDRPPRESRRVVIDIDSASADGRRFEIEIDTDEADDGAARRRIIVRRRAGVDGETERVVQLRLPDAEQVEAMIGDLMDGSLAVFRTDDGDTTVERMMGEAGTSPETRDRMRRLEAQARTQAERARTAKGADRRRAESDLDRTLSDLFDARAQARREHAASLRERAAALAAQADDIDADLADRQSRRRALIEARRDALLGGTSGW